MAEPKRRRRCTPVVVGPPRTVPITPEDYEKAVHAIAVAVLVSVGYCVWPTLRWATTRYVLTTERLVIKAGVLRASVIEMPLVRVGDIESHSSLIENIFGCGMLVVVAVGGRDVLELRRMPKVSDVGQTLNLLAHSG